MLKLRAIYLNDGVGVAIQNFRRSFDHASFSRAGRAQKKHCADRPVWRVHAGEKYLVKATHAPYCALLSYDASIKTLLEVLGARAFLIRIQEDCAHGFV